MYPERFERDSEARAFSTEQLRQIEEATKKCVVCDMLDGHPDATCFIVDVGRNPETTCDEHSPVGTPFIAKDYLELNTWAGNLGAGIHPYKVIS